MGLEEERQDLHQQWGKYDAGKRDHIPGLIVGFGSLVILVSPMADATTKTLAIVGLCVGLYCFGRWWHCHRMCQDVIKRQVAVDLQLDAERRANPQ